MGKMGKASGWAGDNCPPRFSQSHSTKWAFAFPSVPARSDPLECAWSPPNWMMVYISVRLGRGRAKITDITATLTLLSTYIYVHKCTCIGIGTFGSFLRRRINSRHCRPGDLWCRDHIKHGRFSRTRRLAGLGVSETETKCGLSTLEVCARLG